MDIDIKVMREKLFFSQLGQVFEIAMSHYFQYLKSRKGCPGFPGSRFISIRVDVRQWRGSKFAGSRFPKFKKNS